MKMILPKLISLFFIFNITTCSAQQEQTIKINRGIYTVEYSETKEQPVSLTYKSTNRPKNVDRKDVGNSFWKPKDLHTSDDDDYSKNIWDKGHLLPAATVSHNKDSLLQSFSYENCALQHKDLNRKVWNHLEQQERVWDDKQDLIIFVELKFSDSVLPTGATIPSRFIKHIKFTKDNIYKCYDFPNSSPTKSWQEYEVIHFH